MQETFKAGERLKHAVKTEWGLGEVLADAAGGQVRILFEDIGIKLFNLAQASFVRVSGEEGESDYLTALVKHYHTEIARPASPGASSVTFRPFPKAVEDFLGFFPGGFQDPRYLSGKSGEREYKVEANRLMLKLLGEDVFRELLKQSAFDDIVARSKSVMNKTNLINQYEKIWFGKGLDSAERRRRFSECLFDHLYGPDPIEERFSRFASLLSEMGAAKWPVATYFLFAAFPETHVFLKPEVTKSAARVLGMDINYRPELKWLTYSRVLEMANLMTERLRSDGREILVPRDMIDVQSFIWVIAPGYY